MPVLAAKSHREVMVLSTKRDVFYFKMCPSFRGATVEVTAADGHVVFSGKMSHLRGMLDFYYEQPGRYVITIGNGAGKIEKFDYVKSSPSPFLEVTQSQGVTLFE